MQCLERAVARLRHAEAAVGFDAHPCSPVPHGHILLLRSDAFREAVDKMPLHLSQLTLRDLILQDASGADYGYKEGLMAFFPKDSFELVPIRDLPRYRYAFLSSQWSVTSLHDKVSAMKGRGWTRVPYVFFDVICVPQEDRDYHREHFGLVFGEVVELNSEIHIFGTSSLRRTWVLNELARARRPIIYTAADFAEGLLLQTERSNGVTAESYPGFEKSEARDQSAQSQVKPNIEKIHGSVINFDKKVCQLLLWQSDSGPEMRLLRVDALLNCSVLAATKPMQIDPKMSDVVKSILETGDTTGSLTSHQVRATYWWGEAHSVDGLFFKDAFVDLSWSDFRKASYAVLTYGWATITWSDIIAVLKKVEMKVQYIWIDIFCLSQCNPQPASTMKVIERSPAIYGGAKEYHVFGKVVASRGWCVCELASARNPVLHSVGSAVALPPNGLAHKVDLHPSTSKEFRGFEQADFFNDSDRPEVRKMIETQNFSVTNFDAEMRHFFEDKFGKEGVQ